MRFLRKAYHVTGDPPASTDLSVTRGSRGEEPDLKSEISSQASSDPLQRPGTFTHKGRPRASREECCLTPTVFATGGRRRK